MAAKTSTSTPVAEALALRKGDLVSITGQNLENLGNLVVKSDPRGAQTTAGADDAIVYIKTSRSGQPLACEYVYASQVQIRVLKRKDKMDDVPYVMAPDVTMATDSIDSVVVNEVCFADAITNSTSIDTRTAETIGKPEVVDPHSLVVPVVHTADSVHDAMNKEDSTPSDVSTKPIVAVETTVVREETGEKLIAGTAEIDIDTMDLTVPSEDPTSLDV